MGNICQKSPCQLSDGWFPLFYWPHLSRERPQSSGTPLGATTTLKYWSAHTPQTWAESGKDGFSRQATWGHICTLEKSRTNMTKSDITSSLESHWVRQLFRTTAQHIHIRLEQSLDKLRDDTDCQNHHLIMPISCKTSQYCCANKFCPKNFSTLYLNLK